MPPQTQNLLIDLKEQLSQLYGAHLDGLYLFGSYARGEQDSESDVDILVVLDHSFQQTWRRTPATRWQTSFSVVTSWIKLHLPTMAHAEF
jgi:UTP:GlnB (protein PII) uridylyltransferase